MAIVDVIEGGFNKEPVGITKYENRKIIQMEMTLSENYSQKD